MLNQVLVLPARQVISQSDLERVERMLKIKVLTDGMLLEENMAVVAKLDAGAVIEPGPLTYHRHLMVVSRGDF